MCCVYVPPEGAVTAGGALQEGDDEQCVAGHREQTYHFQVDLLKDQLDDMEERLLEVQSKHHDRCKVSQGQGRVNTHPYL